MVLLLREELEVVYQLFYRYAIANNKYIDDKYDASEPSIYITYLDANNIYSWAMCKKLTTDNLTWMGKEELENWRNIPCILQVDLEYPKELHDSHNDFPLAPERLKVGNVEKPIPNFYDKEKYIIHYDDLKLYTSLGLKSKRYKEGSPTMRASGLSHTSN